MFSERFSVDIITCRFRSGIWNECLCNSIDSSLSCVCSFLCAFFSDWMWNSISNTDFYGLWHRVRMVAVIWTKTNAISAKINNLLGKCIRNAITYELCVGASIEINKRLYDVSIVNGSLCRFFVLFLFWNLV